MEAAGRDARRHRVSNTFPRNFIANLQTALLSSAVLAVRFFKYWLPVVLWMILIFGGSTNLGAPKNTSRIIVPFLHWLVPTISDQTVERVQFAVRKCGHLTEYAILGLLLWRARRNSLNMQTKGWRWSTAGFAILVSATYAATDEFHQYFVSTRQASVWDVLIDTTGATVGMILLWKLGGWFKCWE